jgi:superfamily I DNA and RNA helicase
MAAHYFGMGLKRREGAVQAITTQPGWENLGYEVVEGDFRKTGEEIRIRRPKQNSPHPLSEHDEARPFVRFSAAETKREEIEIIGESISRDINDHGLAPEQIMVIFLDKQSQSETDEPTGHLESVTGDNIVFNRVWDGETSVFEKDGEVTVTRINRAKGNEAAMVYITGLEHVDDVSSGLPLVQRRNQAFVAMTGCVESPYGVGFHCFTARLML